MLRRTSPSLWRVCACVILLLASVRGSNAADPGSVSRRPEFSKEALFVNVSYAAEQCPPQGSKLVIGSICDFAGSEITPFLTSWRIHAPRTHIVIMVCEDSQRKKFPWTKFDYSDLHNPPYVRVLPARRWPSSWLPHYLNWNGWRVFLHKGFLEICRKARRMPKGIFLSDSRDAVALSNPWAHPLLSRAVSENMVIFSYEGSPTDNGAANDLLVKDEPVNTRWVINCFNQTQAPALVDRILESPVACSGVVLGGGQAVLQYARAMVETALTIPNETCIQTESDQVIHLFVVHWLSFIKNLTFKHVSYSNGISPVYTAGLGGPLSIDRFGVITVPRRRWNHLPVYVHQYNRKEKVEEILRTVYGTIIPRSQEQKQPE